MTEKAIALTIPNENDTQALAQWAVDSSLYPDIKSKANALAKIVIGNSLGVSPLMALQTIYLVDNKIGLEAQLIKKKLREAGYSWKQEYFDKQGQKINEKTDADKIWGISLTMNHENQDPETYIFTLAHAAQANLLNKTNWKNYPSLMLYHRCITIAARDYAPDCLHGMAYTKEELEGIPAEIVTIEKPEDLVTYAKKQHGAVEIPNISKEFPKLLVAYPDLSLESCWVHHINWEDSEYGPRHDGPRCYLKNLLKDITQEISTKYLGFPTFQEPQKRGDKIVRYQTTEWKGWLRKDCNIDNWNNLDVIEQLKVLERLLPAQPIE
jgi:hypothetical protein